MVSSGDFNYGNYYLPKEYVETKLSRFLLEPGDILITGAGTLGLLVEVPQGVEKGIINQALIRIRLDETIVNKSFFKYFFPYFIKPIACRLNGDSVIPNLPPLSVLKEIEIELPPMQKQEEIASVLSSIDAKMDNNNAICADLEGMAKLLYDYWFVQFDFPDENGKPYKSSGGKMVWNEELKREIPEGWEATTIGATTICHDSERIPVAGKDREQMVGNIPYYGATGVMGYVDRAIFDGDYVLLAEDGSIMDDRGHPIIQRVHGKAWINNHAHVLEPKDGYTCRLLMMLFKDIPVMKIKTGSIQMKINQENMNGYTLVEIPPELRDLICKHLEPIDEMLLNITQENQDLASLRDFLLPMLMNGQVKVGEGA